MEDWIWQNLKMFPPASNLIDSRPAASSLGQGCSFKATHAEYEDTKSIIWMGQLLKHISASAKFKQTKNTRPPITP